MESPKRPIAFVLASTDHGTMILNRNDQDRDDRGVVYGVGIEILMSGVYSPNEIDLARKLLDLRREFHGDNVVAVDCGANIGVHAVEWGRHMTGWGRVIAVEAQERIFYALAGNITINNCFNVEAVHAAVGELDGTMHIPVLDYLKPASFGSLELKPLAHPEDIGQGVDYSAETMVSVRAMRLDALNLQRLDLLKIDVEGMEIDVLRGAQDTLSRCRPVMVIEHLKSDLPTLTDTLKSMGYLIYNPKPYGLNLLAVHESDRVKERVVQTDT